MRIDIWSSAAPSWPRRAVAALFGGVAGLRRLLYRRAWLRSYKLPVPLIVIGNITAGGSGKTPLVMAVVALLRQRGLHPGVISRGYGRSTRGLQRVRANSTAAEVGDEPLLIWRHSQVPVAVAERRIEAAQALLAEGRVDVLIADDGLQHYALQRDIEIAVIDAARGFGNQYRLPAGPLREPLARLRDCDLLVCNGEPDAELLALLPRSPARMQLALQAPRRLSDGQVRAFSAFTATPIHAVAGIGHPQRFFDQLAAAGLQVLSHAFPDHHAYRADDLQFNDDLPLLMTTKDAVKCGDIASANSWQVDVEARLSDDFAPALLALLDAVPKPSKELR